MTAPTKSIVTVTVNPCIDKNCEVDRVVPEHKLRCTSERREPGGGGINVARAVGKLGGVATAMWSRGEPTGTLLADLLAAEGVEQRMVDVVAPTRENLIVYETATGQQYRFGMPGGTMTAAEVDAWCEAVSALGSDAGYLVLSGSLPPGAPEDLYSRLAASAPRDCRVVVDTSGPPLLAALGSERVFMVKPNLHELAALVPGADVSDAKLEAAAHRLMEKGVALVLVSLGAGGAVLATGSDMHTLRAPTVPIASKVGAGDSMVAGAVLSLARGESELEAARFAVAAGAAAVMTPGTELCRREDAEALRECVRVDSAATAKAS